MGQFPDVLNMFQVLQGFFSFGKDSTQYSFGIIPNFVLTAVLLVFVVIGVVLVIKVIKAVLGLISGIVGGLLGL